MATVLRELAEAAARAGGAVLSASAGDARDVRAKSTMWDMVTASDIASGVAVCRAIAERVEHPRFVVEEPEVYALAGVATGTLTDDEVWVVDPLDGTTSFIHGYPCWSVSVACLRFGVPVAGAVYNVPADEMTSAAAGEGALRDGAALACSNIDTLERALLITGFPYDRGEPLERQLRILAAVMKRAHGMRRDGSAAVDCCHVAAGRADGFWELGLSPWDLAAGVLILTEAGARVTDLDGQAWTPEGGDIVAANPRLHAALLEVVAGAASRA